MGDYSGISPGVRVFTATEDVSGLSMMHPTVPAKYRAPTKAPVKIGSHCAVGANSVVLPGAELRDGVVVGALSLVKTKLAEWSVYAGVPVRFIRARSRFALDLQEQLEA
jgi:acetyltransferase-like isoleucine patch superfamily enzyme